MRAFKRLMLAALAGLPLSACAGNSDQRTAAADPNSNLIVTPSGRIVQAPPAALRLGNTGGESGGSGRN